MSRRSRHDRGSALIVAMILMVVLAVVGLAVVKRTTREVDAVASKRHWDRAISCADAARQMLYSQFRTYNINADLFLSRVVGDQQYSTGHYDHIDVHNSVNPAAGSQGFDVTLDVTNRITGRWGGLGGKPYRIVVSCSDRDAPTHQQEVEFLVNFGF